MAHPPGVQHATTSSGDDVGAGARPRGLADGCRRRAPFRSLVCRPAGPVLLPPASAPAPSAHLCQLRRPRAERSSGTPEVSRIRAMAPILLTSVTPRALAHPA